MQKIIGFTYDCKTDWEKTPDDPHDFNAELDPPYTIDYIVKAIESRGHRVKRIGNAANLLSQIDDLGVDIVFNIAEGYRGRNRESEIPVLLEMKGIPFIGSDGLTLGITLDKIIAKKCFIAEGVPTPRFFEATDSRNLEELNTIGFPLIVKIRHEGSSKGLSKDSCVHDYEGLKRQVDLVTGTYHQPALVEEFIRGSEFTVAVLGNDDAQAMPVVQTQIEGKLDLGDKIYTFGHISTDEVEYICPAPISKELTQQLQDMALKAYRCVGCRDFGRVDFRVDEKGQPYVLEINPLPCLGPDDVFSHIPKVLGLTYEDMIERIIQCGLERHGLNNGRYKEKNT